MVGKAGFGPRDPGSNPGWFAVSNSKQKMGFNTQIIQAYDGAMPIVITVTVTSLEGGDKWPL